MSSPLEENLASTESVHVESKNISDDMFFSTMSNQTICDQNQVEDMDELFRINSPAKEHKEIKLDDDDEENIFSGNNSAAIPEPVSIKPALPVQKKTDEQTYSSLSSSMNNKPIVSNATFTSEDEEDEEDKDKFLMVKLSDPSKVGDGMGSYMVYKVTTMTNYPVFKKTEFSTNRRFSDFLSLFEKLKEKHLSAGRILPPAPEKDMIGMAKIKMSKEDATPNEFIEKRRAALERFLNRLAKHKTFRFDPDFRDFLEIADELPKASNTSALSGAGMLKMFKNVTESMSKISIKMDETDQWFDEKSRQVESLSVQLKKLHNTLELMSAWRKDLASATKDFSKHAAILANSEEQLGLSRALSQLGEIYEKVDQIHLEQANSDYFTFAELVKDYVCLLDNIKELFHQRVKMFAHWQRAEETLKSKKESKVKLEAANKLDKIPTVAAEIRDWEAKVEKTKEEFEQISKNIKEEVKRFDLNRIKEFKNDLVKYLENLLNNQEQMSKLWEQYLPQVKAI